jgi:hypothetical protein
MPNTSLYNGLVKIALSLLSFSLVAACAIAPSVAPPLDWNAGEWRTWVLSSGRELRLLPPPDAAATARELQEVQTLIAERETAMQERVRYWDFWSPSARWNDMLVDISAANTLPGGNGIRAFAMHDAMIAAWNTKYAYNRPRPAEIAAQLKTVVPTQRSHSYRWWHAVRRLGGWVRRMPPLSGHNFRSDLTSGWEIGRLVGEADVVRAKADGA